MSEVPNQINTTIIKEMPIPIDSDLKSDIFNKIFDCIKTWDINVPEYYEGYCGGNGSHVKLILDAINKKKEEKPKSENSPGIIEDRIYKFCEENKELILKNYPDIDTAIKYWYAECFGKDMLFVDFNDDTLIDLVINGILPLEMDDIFDYVGDEELYDDSDYIIETMREFFKFEEKE